MDDQELLAQYLETGNSGAFEELTRRYATMVKGVCHRVLGNVHDAEEVAQECFLELARDGGHVHSSVAGWLHRAATTRSLNTLRSRSRRKVREREFGFGTETTSTLTQVTTQELRRVIDGALTAMPDDLRLPMILHYLDGRSQRDVALELGVNQSTISRRMRDALRLLRERLTQAGYAASIPAVTLAMQNQANAAPDSTLVTVAAAGAAGKAAGSATIAGTLKGSAAVALPLLSYFLLGGWISCLIAVSVAAYVARFRPCWVSDVFSSLGVKDLYHQPTFCLARWDWDRPPRDWRVRVQTTIVWSIVFLGLSLVFALGTNRPPWGIVVLGAVAAAGFLAHAWRIVRRVNRVKSGQPQQQINVIDQGNDGGFWNYLIGFNSNDTSVTWFDAIQLVSIGLAALLIAGYVICRGQAPGLWPSVVLSGTVGTGMFAWGSSICWRLFSIRRRTKVNLPLPNESARHSRATQVVLAIGAAIVATLSIWIVWNPAALRGLALSLAAVQTSMLGWLVSRLASHCQCLEFKFIRRAVVALLVCCLVLNSSVCLANWLW